jgi:protein kinase-like protein
VSQPDASREAARTGAVGVRTGPSSSPDDSTLTGPAEAARASAGVVGVPGWWGDLRIDEEVGHGAYGRVYRAWDAALAREVALKIIRVEAADPDAAAFVLREGQMLARVRHRNVVIVYGARQIGGEIGLWMEFVRGRSLARMIHDDGPMAAEEAAVTGLSLCHALAAVHAAGLLHRDIKAQNVMREAGGRIVLMDFGAGRELAARAAGAGELAGTPLYMPPEVLAGRAWSPAGDVYSLGALLYFLVTGRHPIEGRTVNDIVIAHGLGRRRLLADCRADLPDAFVRVVERALAPASERYATAGALLRDLSESIPRSSAAEIARDAEPRAPASAASALASRPAVAARPRLWMAAAVSVPAAVWLLGFLITTAFNTTLERSSGFSSDGALDAWVWGLRATVGPALYMTLALVAYRIVRVAWRLAGRAVPAVERAAARAAAVAGRLAAAAGAADRMSRAQWIIGAQAILLVIAIWRFRALLIACIGIAQDGVSLAPLAPDSDEPVLYRAALSVLLLVGAAWWRRLIRSAADERIDRATAAAGIGVAAIVTLLLSVPFRIVYENSAPGATYAGDRCYITGERPASAQPPPAGDVLLFCPDAPHRIRIVAAGDPLLVRGTAIESIFTARPR